MCVIDKEMENNEKALEKAVSTGLKSMKSLINSATLNQSVERKHASNFIDYLNKLIGSSTSSGHARFRHGSLQPRPTGQSQCSMENLLTLVGTKPGMVESTENGKEKIDCGGILPENPLYITHKGNVLNETGSPSVSLVPLQVIRPVKALPPLKKAYRRGCSDVVPNSNLGSTKCPYKKRKLKDEKIIRVPSVISSSKTEMIPLDEYSWRKYGQKPANGSPYPRNYYKCSITKDCPARKYIEKARDDPTMLIITHKGVHQHAIEHKINPTAQVGGHSLSIDEPINHVYTNVAEKYHTVVMDRQDAMKNISVGEYVDGHLVYREMTEHVHEEERASYNEMMETGHGREKTKGKEKIG